MYKNHPAILIIRQNIYDFLLVFLHINSEQFSRYSDIDVES